MKKLLSLCAVMILGFGSAAIAGGISSTDADFLFGNDQVVAATISDVEMEQTQGQLAIILPPAPITLPTDLTLGVDLLEDSVLGATVNDGLLGGGIAVPLMALAAPFMAMSNEMPFDPSMLTDLLGGAGGLPLDASMLTDLLGGGLATPAIALAQASPINNVNDLTDLINSLGLVNLELFKGSEIVDLDVLGGASGIPLDPAMLTELLGGTGEMPFDPSMLTDLLSSHADALTSMLGGAGGVPLDPSMLTGLLGGGSELPLDPSMLTGLLDPAMLTELLGGSGGAPTLDTSMLTDLLGSLSNSSPLDPNMLNNLLVGTGGVPDVSMLTDLLSGNGGNALVGVIGVLPL